ncbi:MAG: prolipoprotein diacylglyceryl transferase [bacterium]|nr:prolipoprotein diacylglyceryl transferase [bacterium]
MIPDLHWAEIPLGSLSLQVWGLFVATGIAVAIYVAKKVADKEGLQGNAIVDASFWIIIGSMVGARLFFVLTELGNYTSDWLGIFRVWEGGMSINGGYLGALIAAVIFFRKRKLSFWRYGDIIVYALPLGKFIGRLGCFFVFDHPGSVTEFFLGEEYYVDQLIRHNHGLYLSLNGLVMFLVFVLLKKKFSPKAPYFMILFLPWYGLTRILLDSDRILDSAIAGQTPAQWVGMFMIVLGLILFGQRQNIRKKMIKARKKEAN